MSFRAVQAVFVWRLNQSAFGAIYGRAPARGAKNGASVGSYTKNFLQSPASHQAVLDRMLGRSPNGEVEFEFIWPSGSRSGHWQKSAADERGQLFWDENSNPPDPWKIGDPATQPSCTIEGDPTKTTVPDANAEFARIDSGGTKPVLVLVKLWGEEARLYPRVLLTNPPATQSGRGVAALPEMLRRAIEHWLAGTESAFAHDFSAPHRPLRAPALVERIIKALQRDPNILLVGPPGTGKTVALEDLRSLFEAKDEPDVLFDPDAWDNAWSQGAHPFENGHLPPDSERKVEPLVFHPSYGFEEFVAGLVPHVDDKSHGIRLEARPGPLLSLACWASSVGRRALLVIDEFNRGPAATIFGDTLALLDGSKRSDPAMGKPGASIRRPYPRSTMKVAPGYADADGNDEIGQEVRLPASLWIVAAMNSSDRSVAPLDAALRRRFSIIYIGPDYEALARQLGLAASPADDPPEMISDWEIRSEEDKQSAMATLAVRLLFRLNERIASVLGQDFLLGHALLWDVRREIGADMLDALATAFDQRIAATLRLTFLDQDEALAAILNLPPSSSEGGALRVSTGRVAHWRPPPRGLEAIASPRLEFTEVSLLNSENAKLRALQALL